MEGKRAVEENGHHEARSTEPDREAIDADASPSKRRGSGSAPPFPSESTIRQAKGRRLHKKSHNIHNAHLARKNSADLRAEWAELLKKGADLVNEMAEKEPVEEEPPADA